jgi:hypothetical protein
MELGNQIFWIVIVLQKDQYTPNGEYIRKSPKTERSIRVFDILPQD